jgi:O-methyltransferase involved in polyketide biosynthesis
MTDATVLNGVPETLLVPLFYRAKETREADPLIRDDKAVEIVNSINYDFSHCNKWMTQASVVIRLEIFQERIRAALQRHPDSVVINLAAGLDNLFGELDNGKVDWYDLDLPQVIGIRKHYFEETHRRRFIACDALDTAWFDSIADTDGRPVLVVAEGLLPYLPEAAARRLLSSIFDRFENIEIILDIFGSFTVGREWVVSEFKHINPKPSFLWSPHNPYELESWDPRFKITRVDNLFDRHPKRWRMLKILGSFSYTRNLMGNRIITINRR